MGKAPYSRHVGKDVDEDTFSFAALVPKIETTASSQEPAEYTDSASGGLSPAGVFIFKGQLVPHPFLSPTAHNPRTYSDLNRSGSYTTANSLASSRGDSITSSRSSSSRSGSSRQNSGKRLLAPERVSAGLVGDEKPGQSASHPGVVPLQQLLHSPAIIPTVIPPSKLSRRRNPEWSVDQGIVGGNASGVKKEKESRSSRWWVSRKIFRPIVSACRECHALEPERLPAIPRTN